MGRRRSWKDYLRAAVIRVQGHRAMWARRRALRTGARPAAAPRTALLPCALVIPARDDHDGLAHLLDQAAALNCFAEVIVIDDGSSPPLEAPGARLLRHETAQGGGAARNTGLDAVTAPYLLFFDADDHLTDALPHLLADLAQESFDLCLFKHADSRLTDQGRWGQPYSDERWWQDAGLARGTLRQAPPDTWPLLARTQNYPWNKILRTGLLRENGIRCGTTQVHNDISLHWEVFLAASRVMTSDRICAYHQVDAQGDRITNRKGPERLAVFDALTPVARIVTGREPAWQAALADFALGVIDWNRRQIAPAHLPALEAAEAEWLAHHVAPWLPTLERADPPLAAAVKARLPGP